MALSQTFLVYFVNLGSSALSFFGSLAIILNYIFFTNKSQLMYKLIFYLSVADFGGSLSICISQLLLIADPDGYSLLLCKVFRACINFFFVSSFCWTSAISLHIFVSSKQIAQIPQIWFHVACWGIPSITTTVLVTGNMFALEEQSGWCHLQPFAMWALWFAPLIVSFLFNAVLYLLIIIRYYNPPNSSSLSYLNERQRKVQQKIKKRITLYLFVFFLCWIWDLINNIISFIHPHMGIYWLWVLQSLFFPLQGFLNFLVYGVSSRMFSRQPSSKDSERKRLLGSVQ
jgi:hypothetical protein